MFWNEELKNNMTDVQELRDRLGLDDCGKLVHELTEQAVSAVSDLDRDGFLTALAESLTERTK